MSGAHEIKRSVLEMYLSHPFPQWTQEVRRSRMASEICRYEFLGLADALKGARFLDVGCGTANRSVPVAKHFGVREYVGFDHSAASLAIARRVSEEEELDQAEFVEGDLFHLPYPDGHFDVVASWGVIHHTHDPFAALVELVRVCRPGGFVGVFLYNRWNHWRHNLQKDKVSRLAGPDVEDRFRVAHELYGEKPVGEMTPEEVAFFYDKYCHPHKSDHTIGETLEWFDRLGLRYWGSYLPMRFFDLLACIQYRARLAAQSPPERAFLHAAVRLAAALPALPRREPPFERPGLLHRALWAALWTWSGRHGEYSDGAALAARKA